MIKIKSVFRFPNGMLAVFGNKGQIPELQGRDSTVLRKKIFKLIDKDTKLYGIDRECPICASPVIDGICTDVGDNNCRYTED